MTMPRCILRLQTDRVMTAAQITAVENFIDDREAFFDYVLFKKIDQEEEDTVLREKGL